MLGVEVEVYSGANAVSEECRVTPEEVEEKGHQNDIRRRRRLAGGWPHALRLKEKFDALAHC